MRVYIAAPLTQGNRLQNIRKAIDAAERVAVRGHRVFIPHLNAFWELFYNHEYEFWMQQDIAWLQFAEIVVRLPGMSEGADREVGLAKQRGIPVFEGLDAFMHSVYWYRTND